MEFDVYQPCPVHQEKKIKFCCGKEVAAGLAEIFDKVDARQPTAALESLNRLIDKYGPKDCLLSLKVQLLASLERHEEAAAVNEQFLVGNPNHPLGLEQRSVMLAKQGRLVDAFDALQSALDNLPDAKIPVGFATAFAAVGAEMLNHGMLWSARSHVAFAAKLRPDDDQIAQMEQYLHSLETNLFTMRPTFPLELPDSDAEWRKKFENSAKAFRRGQFRKSVALAKKAYELAPHEPLLLIHLAHMQSSLPDLAALRAAWQAVAECKQLSLVQRVEAAGIVQAFSPSDASDKREVHKYTLEITGEFDDALATARASRRFLESAVEGEEFEHVVPPPRAFFYFFDRDRIDSCAGKGLREIPSMIAQALYFGKQTDRPARVELIVQGLGNSADVVNEFLRTMPQTASCGDPEIIGHVPTMELRLRHSLYLPANTARADFERIQREYYLDLARNVLPSLPFSSIQGKTLREIVATDQGKISAMAIIEKLYFSLDGTDAQEEFRSTLYEQVGIPPLPRYLPAKLGREVLSPFQLYYVEFENLDPDDFIGFFLMAVRIDNINLQRRVVHHALETQKFSDQLPEESVLLAAAKVELDDDRCFEYLDRAAKAAEKTGNLLGTVLEFEFEQRVLRGRFEGLRELLTRLEKNHLRDPDVRSRLAYFLMRTGMIRPDGSIRIPKAPSASAPESALWTPDNATIATSSSGSEPGASKLWIPGQ